VDTRRAPATAPAATRVVWQFCNIISVVIKSLQNGSAR